MSEWLGALGAILVAGAIIVVPGYAVVRILGFRGLHAWAFAGPVAVPVIAGASLIAPLVGLPWSVWALLAVAGVACLIALALRLSLRKWIGLRPTTRPRAGGALAVGLVLGGILIAAQFVLIVGDPRNISQTFDNIFHLNAARYILDTQNASPLSVSQLTQGVSDRITFYPALWHGVVALVAGSTGASLAVASNAVMIAAGALVWPASLMLLGTQIFGRTHAYVVALGILSAAAPAFPILMIDYGVLFPYFLAVCTLPAIIAGTLALFGLTQRTPGSTFVPWLVVLAAAVPGLLLVHPSAFIAWLLLAVIAAIVAFVLFARRRPGRRRIAIAAVALGVAGVAGFALWRALRPAIDLNLWPPSQTPGQALGEVLTLSMQRAQIPVLPAAAMLLGVVAAWRRGTVGSRIAVAYLAVLMVMFIITTSMQWLWLRRAIAAAWYDNSPRLAALIPLMAVPIAALGVEAAWRWFVRRGPRRVTTHGAPAYATLVAVGCVALVAATQLISIPNAIERARYVYIPSESSPLLTPDEFALLRELPELVPSDAVIAGNPGTGTAMAYAIAGIEVLHPSVIIAMNDDITLIDNETNDASPGSPVCGALQRTGVNYVLDFGTQQINGENYQYPGFEDLDNSEAVELVKQIGEARLYRVVGCDGE